MQTAWLLVSIVIPILVSMVMWKLFAPDSPDMSCYQGKLNFVFVDRQKSNLMILPLVCKKKKKTIMKNTVVQHKGLFTSNESESTSKTWSVNEP